MVLDNKIRIAISRIIIDMINADGIVDERELSKFEEFQDTYQLLPCHLLDAQYISLSEAINTIKQHVNDTYIPDNDKLDKLTFLQRIEHLALSDGHTTPQEAIICLALRYVLDSNNINCAVFSCRQDRIQFSKKEVVFIETEFDEDLNSEIRTHYANIRNIFRANGYEFIYIPQLCQDFYELNNSDLSKIILYLNPTLYANENIKERLMMCLPSIQTSDFSASLLAKTRIRSISPSLLFKLKSSRIQSKESTSSVKYSEFLFVEISDSSILLTAQSFFYKYINLVKDIDININHSSNENQFNYRGFHKTLFDFLIHQDINNIVITIAKSKKEHVVCFGNLGGCHMSSMQLSIYILIIYSTLHINGGLYTKDSSEHKYKDTQLNLYNKIYKIVNRQSADHNDMEFYKTLQNRYGKIKEQIYRIPHLNNKDVFMPKWNKAESRYTIGFDKNLSVIMNMEEEQISLFEWISRLES